MSKESSLAIITLLVGLPVILVIVIAAGVLAGARGAWRKARWIWDVLFEEEF